MAERETTSASDASTRPYPLSANRRLEHVKMCGFQLDTEIGIVVCHLDEGHPLYHGCGLDSEEYAYVQFGPYCGDR